MEFHIAMGTVPMDPDVVEGAIRDLDPAALVDISGSTLRISTSLLAPELTQVITAAGYAVDADHVTQLPSICCGGCSG